LVNTVDFSTCFFIIFLSFYDKKLLKNFSREKIEEAKKINENFGRKN